MPRGYHTWRPGNPPGGVGHGQVAVVPLCDGSDPRPHETWHVGPVQLFTVQPVGGQVTWQSGLDLQSTEHDDAWLHSTWQCSPAAQPTLHGAPGAHWTSQASPPVVHAWLHGASSGQMQ